MTASADASPAPAPAPPPAKRGFALTSAYAAGDLSLVYPVARGSAALAVVPLAVVVLGERPSPSGLAAIYGQTRKWASQARRLARPVATRTSWTSSV